jgi:hypothetical protein
MKSGGLKVDDRQRMYIEIEVAVSGEDASAGAVETVHGWFADRVAEWFDDGDWNIVTYVEPDDEDVS